MGCGASNAASTSVLEPRQVEEMRDDAPHREVAPVAARQHAPLRVIRFQPENCEALERRAGVTVHSLALPTALPTVAQVTPPAAAAASSGAGVAGVAEPARPAVSAGDDCAALDLLFSPRPSSNKRNVDRGRGFNEPTRWPSKNHVGPRRHSAQRRAVALHTQPHRLAEHEEKIKHQQPTRSPTTVMHVPEQRSKQPCVMSSDHRGEGFLPRKLPPIRRTWMTNLATLPAIEKSSPPRQLRAGLARARDEVMQNTAAADIIESQARLRAENFARRNSTADNMEDLRVSQAKLAEMQEQSDAALASITTARSHTTALVNDDAQTTQFPAGFDASCGKMSWSCGTGSLDLDMLELSTSSLSLSQEIERSCCHDASQFAANQSLATAKA